MQNAISWSKFVLFDHGSKNEKIKFSNSNGVGWKFTTRYASGMSSSWWIKIWITSKNWKVCDETFIKICKLPWSKLRTTHVNDKIWNWRHTWKYYQLVLQDDIIKRLKISDVTVNDFELRKSYMCNENDSNKKNYIHTT